ncbi:MAG TPA: hypothetical protein VK470_05540, partial [Bacteroidota bacterium]|nr:hypothetical protein [Bacteroidota bacterium]
MTGQRLFPLLLNGIFTLLYRKNVWQRPISRRTPAQIGSSSPSREQFKIRMTGEIDERSNAQADGEFHLEYL